MEQHAGFTLRDIAHVLFKRKWLIVCFFLSTVAGAVAIGVLSDQPMYEATAQLLLRPGREHVSDLTLSTTAALKPQVSYHLEEQAASTLAMLTSPYMTEQLVGALGARTLCYEQSSGIALWLRKPFCDLALDDQALAHRVALLVAESSVRAERLGDSALINLSFRHPDPAIAASAANKLGALYLERHLMVLNNPRTDAFILEQLDVLKARASQAERAINDFKARHGISSTVAEEHEITQRRLNALEAEYQETRARAAEAHSRLDQLNAEARSRGSLYLQDERLRGQTELEALRARLATQERLLSALRSKAQMLGGLGSEFVRLQQRLEMEQQNLGLYVTKSEEARVAQAMDAEKIASVRVIDSAHVPALPLPSKVGLKILLAVLFGAFGGVVIAFALELIGDRLETAERAETILGVPVLASLPGSLGVRRPALLPSPGGRHS